TVFHGRGYRQTISVATDSQWTRTRFARGRGSTLPLRLSTSSARCWEKCASTASQSVPTDATAPACGHSLRAPAATSHAAVNTLWGPRFGCADSFARNQGTPSYVSTITSRNLALPGDSQAIHISLWQNKPVRRHRTQLRPHMEPSATNLERARSEPCTAWVQTPSLNALACTTPTPP